MFGLNYYNGEHFLSSLPKQMPQMKVGWCCFVQDIIKSSIKVLNKEKVRPKSVQPSRDERVHHKLLNFFITNSYKNYLFQDFNFEDSTYVVSESLSSEIDGYLEDKSELTLFEVFCQFIYNLLQFKTLLLNKVNNLIG